MAASPDVLEDIAVFAEQLMLDLWGSEQNMTEEEFIVAFLKSNSQSSKSYFQAKHFTQAGDIRLASMPNGYCYFYALLGNCSVYSTDDDHQERDITEQEL